MTNDLKQYLQQIVSVDAEYGKKPNSPAQPTDIMHLKATAWSLNEYTIPTSYEEILLYTNGMDFNGHLLYGSYPLSLTSDNKKYASMDFGIANKIWEDYGDNEYHNLIMFGESGLSLYIYNRNTTKFEVIDRVGGDSFFDSDSFDGLLERLFKDMLSID